MVTQQSFAGDALYREETDGYSLPGVADENGNVSFPHLHMKLKLEPRWLVQEEVAPVPTVALVHLMHEDFAGKDPREQMMPGQIPVVMISCEDTSAEGGTLDDAKEKAKNMGMMQLHMMGQGMFPPQLTKDSSADVGHFKRIVEISQRTPHFELQVINYFGIKNGVVYSFQMMASPSLVSKYRHDFATMVRNCELLDNPAQDNFTSVSYIIAPMKDKSTGSFKVPSSWNISKGENKIPASICPESTVLAACQSASAQRPEYVIIVNAEPNTAELTKIDSKSATVLDDVQFTEYKSKESSKPKHYKIFKHPSESLWLVSGPVTLDNQLVGDVVFANVLKSVSTTSPAPISASNCSGHYKSERFGFEFDVRKGGKIMEASIGEKVVMYAPYGGLDQSSGQQPTEAQIQAAQEQPIVTIRVGDPETDPDCKETLDEWASNVKSQSEGGLTNVRKDTIGDVEFLTFENKEMVEVGEGRKEERMAKMFVTICNRRSTMIRWESTTGVWRKYEGQMMEMIRSVKVF